MFSPLRTSLFLLVIQNRQAKNLKQARTVIQSVKHEESLNLIQNLSKQKKGKQMTNKLEFTPQEQIVYTKLLENKNISEIAKEMSLSITTIKTHAEAVYEKLHITGTNRRFQLLHRCTTEQFQQIKNQYEKVVEQNKNLQQELRECQSDYKEAMKQLMSKVKAEKGKE